ncbi:MAG: hypothetical protein A4E65_00745 [Syntrophorhabdus sp. PtaU1.Bin153]|nr:MAG: hypothetical protein A4E65_00745 [Syntrophorhabdus sp. PtaU1.Bin153]
MELLLPQEVKTSIQTILCTLQITLTSFCKRHKSEPQGNPDGVSQERASLCDVIQDGFGR